MAPRVKGWRGRPVVRRATITPDEFRRTVYDFFRAHGRDLPWRRTVTPYTTFVSEIMLQQTQVDRVIPKFEAFLHRFPSFSSLADASLRDVLGMWQGLGYNRRALAMKRAAEAVVREYGGSLPERPEALDELPGIGPATAASIAAFAFNRPTIFLETNIRTVFIHHFFAGRDGIDDERIRPLVELTLDRSNPREWYSALMDYGTYLKKEIGNLSRRSAHYKKQSRFSGSRRQIRGQVLKVLLAEPTVSARSLATSLSVDRALLDSVTAELEAEGMIEHSGRSLRLASGAR